MNNHFLTIYFSIKTKHSDWSHKKILNVTKWVLRRSKEKEPPIVNIEEFERIIANI